MGAVTVKVDASGALVVPKETLEALGIPDGGHVRLAAEDPGQQAAAVGPGTVAELRALLRPWRRPTGSVVEDLLLERRLEAALEEFDTEEARRLRAAFAAVRD
jgi:bifunctional DNA-binding transcriptional regulator/antitoxin component of YhaV-PrlF toxin-antitoxin module